MRRMFQGHRIGDTVPCIWDPEIRIGDMLRGKRGLVIGLTDTNSIAYACAAKLRAFGVELAVTYPNENAGHRARTLAEGLGAKLILPLAIERPGQSKTVFDAVRDHWGKLDFVIHSIAGSSPGELNGRVLDCSLQEFQRAMHVSCYAVIEMARLAAPLLRDGGSLVILSDDSAGKIVDRDNPRGPIQAALEASVRSIAQELGPSRIRACAVSPGLLTPGFAGGIAHFDPVEISRVVTLLVGGSTRGTTGDDVFIDRGLQRVA
jgi:enoyl-[acyl-carrier protein] reductase I